MVYKGRRYKLVELKLDPAFDIWTTDDADYVLWDGEYDAYLALVNRIPDGGFRGILNAHVDLTYEYKTLRETVSGLIGEMESYLKSCCG